ncbi:MAG: signal peptide peptidase SppA [Verrucomicrobia bacterium]|nr:MAG: signal peptide peptidase SppA [Verrucomicrobiota bacterium]
MNDNAPPVISSQASQRPIPAKKSWGWMWFSLCLLGCLLLSGALVVVLAIGSFGMSMSTNGGSAHVEVVTLRNNDSDNKIAVIDLAGLIASFSVDASGNNMVESIRRQFKWAREDDDVRAVLFRINSPGGEVLASDRIYEIIRDFQDECDKPVVAVMGALAASGGYYVAAPCNWIVAHELTITGSIGVIMHGYNLRNLMDKVGVQPMVFKSGKHKDMLSFDKREEDITPEERRMVQDLIDETFGRFKKIVREGRDLDRRDKPDDGKALVDNWEEQADGRILSGTQALGQGFVDELGDLDTATDRALKLADHADADLIQYRQPMNLANLFRLFGKSEAKEIKIDLGVDLPKLKAGRLYFLSPTLLY